MPEHSHQLAAILFADIVNYTAMMQEDENTALEKITRFRHVIDIIVEELEGKVIQYYGDGCLVLFNSATDAVEFAKLLQTDFNEEPKVPVRIGIHMGDVLIRDGNVFGDVVNIASRIQALSPPGGIYVSEMVYRNIANKKGMDSVFIKEEFLKNVKTPVRIYEVLTEYSKTVYHTGPNDEQVAIDENSIAVLPFVNMSSDKEQEYFSDGLTEDIITNAVTDEHLWSESYDRPVDDIFTIQREVALAIASVLNTTLTKKESQQLDYVPTVNLQAYDFYMRGKFLIEKRNKTDLLIARELFQQAVTKDRTFADAYSGLATTYLLSSFRGYEDPVRMLWLAKKNIDTALGLDPSSGEIQATLGYWYHQTFDWHAAEITYRRAIDLNANQANVYLWLGILLEAKEEKEEALKIYAQGTELNPMWDYLVENRIRALVNNNQTDEAIALQKKLVDKAAVDPSLQKIYYEDLSRLYWFLNNKEEAIEAAERSRNKALIKFYTDGDFSGLEKEVDKNYNELKEKSEYVSQVWMGIDYARAGARDKALDCFNNAIALKETAITFLLLRHFDFLNIKYLSMALITRKIRQTINF